MKFNFRVNDNAEIIIFTNPPTIWRGKKYLRNLDINTMTMKKAKNGHEKFS